MDWIYIILIIMIFIFLMIIIIYLFFLMRKYKIELVKKDKSYELILSDMVNMILNKKSVK
jgi:flagellar basal body-associated protein FliL